MHTILYYTFHRLFHPASATTLFPVVYPSPLPYRCFLWYFCASRCWHLPHSLCRSGRGLVNQSWWMGPEQKPARSISERFSSVINRNTQEETPPLLCWTWAHLPANDIWNSYSHLATITEEIANTLRMAEYKNEKHLGPPRHCSAA